MELRGLPNAVAGPGLFIFVFAMMALGVETILCARVVDHSMGAQYAVIPILPYLPAVSWFARLFGLAWATLGLGLAVGSSRRFASWGLGSLLILSCAAFEIPKWAEHLGSLGLRGVTFEALALAGFALLVPDASIGGWLRRASTLLLAASLIVLATGHFQALRPFATLVPDWIPGHVFWVGFFGVALVLGGLAIGSGICREWAALSLGVMFGTWVLTLHIPRVMAAPTSADEWSSLFIAIGFWGGSWAIARTGAPSRAIP